MQDVNGVAVLDESGCLVDNISSRDLRVIHYSDLHHNVVALMYVVLFC